MDNSLSRGLFSATKIVPIQLTKSQSDIVASGSDFAFDFFREMSARSGGQNILVSPFSLQVALSMLANGAEAETYEEIVKALGWSGYTIDEINGLYETLTSQIAGIDKDVTLEIANSAWMNGSINFRKDYVDVLDESYAAEAFSVDFGSSDILDRINGWCSDKTHGMIPKMLDKINPQTAYMLINALYFKGIWTEPFDSGKTKNGNFTTAAGKSKMPFMNGTRDCIGVNSKDLQMCSLSYGGGAFSLDIVLPAKGTDFDKFVAGFDEQEWNAILREQRIYETTMSLPKFECDYSSEENIIPFLKGRGMKRAFDSMNAQFGKMSEQPTFVDKVLQKTSFKTDEKGSEAAAVTVIQGVLSAANPSVIIETPYMTFDASRPFIYIIREYTSGTILFIGTFRG